MTQLLDLFGFLSVVLRGLTLALQSLVIGGMVFALLVDRGESGAAAARACRRLLVGSALALALAQAAFVAADSAILMTTADLGLAEVAGASFFLAGSAAVALALAAALLSGRGSRRQRWVAALVLAGGLLATSVATSHAAARLENRAIPILLTALHQAATACWVGGLPYLLIALARARDAAAARLLAARFSRLAQVGVAVLVGAGLGLATLYVGSAAAVLGTAYGAMVGAKVMLLLLLLGLGALNYFIVRRVEAGDAGLLARLRRFAEAEVGIGFTVVLAAASLTSQPPAADLTSAPVPLAEIAARMAPRWPRLTPPAARDMVAPSRLAPATVASQALESFVPGQLAEPPTPGETDLSEFNHHVSGVVVLSAGLLALAARAGWRWARNWPLAFLALAAFLFLLADAEYWPVGPLSFWRGFTVSEALQHRLAVLLIVAFAYFERRVQTGRTRSPAVALVFPFVCVLGGALLLTHSHSLNNPREELLVELSHVPIAVLGVAAGWSRWLELRLEDGRRRTLSWVWPICFILVGAVLIAYRET
ncbi:MAG TPA: CopD family protein [Thermoanaerobaculia bacterium]|nr:CopD family protein [Thermoanaerobaculia bacterium]